MENSRTRRLDWGSLEGTDVDKMHAARDPLNGRRGLNGGLMGG